MLITFKLLYKTSFLTSHHLSCDITYISSICVCIYIYIYIYIHTYIHISIYIFLHFLKQASGPVEDDLASFSELF